MTKIRLLCGGSPCTYWSIAQSQNRETKAEGLGWELFKNFLIAKEKFKPDYFFYENNKSAAQAIKTQIADELEQELMYVNSALVSAQNRQRFYVFNWQAEQPVDRGILLYDILESGKTWLDKSYTLDSNYWKTTGSQVSEYQSGRRQMVAERVSAQVLNINPTGRGMNGAVLRTDTKCRTLTTNKGEGFKIIEQVHNEKTMEWQGKSYPVYQVRNGLINIKGKTYLVRLQDGYYIIRKLTPIECERLQTLPDNYTAGVSNTQRYRQTGNGWTAEVIKHLWEYGIGKLNRNTPIEVLSMYDGIATARYVLDSMGFKNVHYVSYEIDKYAIKVAQRNYPTIVQCGDAFDLRNDDWSYDRLSIAS